MADERITLEVYLENGQFKTQVKDTTQGIEKIGQSAGSSSSGVRGMASGFSSLSGVVKGFMGLGIVTTLYNIGKAALSGAAELQKNKIAFTQMLGSAQAAKNLLKEIQTFAAKTPFELPGVVEASKRLIAFGVPAEEVIQKMTNLGNAAMGNQEQFERLSYAYGKMAAKGKVTMEELNMVTEAGVPILQELAKNYNTSTGNMLKMIEQGKIGFQDVDKALSDITTGQGKFAGIMEKQAATLGGQWSNLKDNFGQILTQMGDAVSPFITRVLEGFNILLTGIVDIAKSIGAAWEKYVTEPQRKARVQWAIEVVNKGRKFYNHGAWEQAGRILQEEKARQDALKQPVKGTGPKGGGTTFTPTTGGADVSAFREKWAVAGESGNAYAKLDEERLQADLKANELMARNSQELAETKLNIDRWYMAEKEKIDIQSAQKTIQAMQMGLGYATQVYGEIAQTAQMYQQAEYDDKMSKLASWYDSNKKTIEDSTMSEAAKKTQLEALEKKYNKKQNEIKKKAFEQEKKWRIANIWMEYARGVVAAWASSMQLGPIAGPIAAGILTGLLTGTTIAQTVLVGKQKYPEASYDVGSYFVPNDQTARVHRGEMIVPAAFAKAVREGQLSISGGSTTNNSGTTINVQGSVIDAQGLLDVVDTARSRKAARFGGLNYARAGVYK